MSSDKRLFRLELKIENTGTVLVPVETLRCEIYQVLPPSETTEKLVTNGDLIDDDGEAKLPCLDDRVKTWSRREFEIEPGECDVVPFDFLIAAEIESVLIYAHVPNCTKGKGIGWDLSTIHDFHVDQPATAPA